LTSISVTSSSSYRYPYLLSSLQDDGDDFTLGSTKTSTGSTSSSSGASSASSSSDSDDSSLIASVEQLISQLMSIMLDMQSSSQQSDGSKSDQSSSGQSSSRIDIIQKMDTNGDGSISKQEFVAARPSDVSENQATSLFDNFDSDGTGSLTEDQLAQAMSIKNQGGPIGGLGGSGDLSDLFTSMDTDGDGEVSEAEFLAAKPDDVSDDQATSLFESMDSSGSGSLTESQFETAMQAKGQPPALPDFDFSSLYASSYQDDDMTSTLLQL